MAMRLYPEIRAVGLAINGKDPYHAYLRHIAGAEARGIGFKFTFEEWWAIWEPHWARRGNKGQEMCMCRTADKGDYEPGNVRIATNRENAHERTLEWRTSHSQRRYQKREYRTPVLEDQVQWIVNRGAFKEYQEEEGV